MCKVEGDPNGNNKLKSSSCEANQVIFTVFMVYVWDCTTKPYQLCLKSRVDLSKLLYIGSANVSLHYNNFAIFIQ